MIESLPFRGGAAVPSEPIHIQQSIRFGDFELIARTRELYRAGRALKLEPTPIELLLLLIEHNAQIVSRDTIIERLWGTNAFFDTDNSINGAIRKIRLALRDTPEKPRFVQTVPGKGYRFIGEIHAVLLGGPELNESEPKAINHQTSPFLSAASQKPPKPQRIWLVLLGMVVIMASTVAALVEWSTAKHHPEAAGGRVMLAVLPFENLTGDPGEDYFSDGLTEEMITQLGRLDPDHLGLIARTSVMQYKRAQAPLNQIARELQVEYLLEGSVRRGGGRVRITAQLIRVKDQTDVWSREYDRNLNDLLDLQSEISREIADEISSSIDEKKINLPIHRAEHTSTNYEAYDLYLKGRYLWNERTVKSLRQAAVCFQKAIGSDPNYAPAYAGLADSYALLGSYLAAPEQNYLPKARTAALKALQLDDKLAEAHTSLALIAQDYDWDWQTAEKEYRRSIELDPNYATGHQWYAEHLAYLGRFDEAVAESQRAQELDPLSLIIRSDYAAILYFSRQYDQAIRQWRAVLDVQPRFPVAHMIALAYFEKGLFSSAVSDIDDWNRPSDKPWNLMFQSYAYRRIGRTAQAQVAEEQLQQLTRSHLIDPAPMIYTYIGMGEKDKAFAWFDKAYAQHSTALRTLKVDPFYDSLRSDPRYEALLHRVGLDRLVVPRLESKLHWELRSRRKLN